MFKDLFRIVEKDGTERWLDRRIDGVGRMQYKLFTVKRIVAGSAEVGLQV